MSYTSTCPITFLISGGINIKMFFFGVNYRCFCIFWHNVTAMQLAFCHASVDDFGSIEVMFSAVANSHNWGGGGGGVPYSYIPVHRP